MTELSNLIAPSARVALAAFLHDLGKFAERAKIDVPDEVIENNQHLYCPYHEEGRWFSHKHAAYTAVALDIIEPDLPSLKGQDMEPFAAWGSDDVDDSLINGAAKHHKPDTFLQWVIATADRVASGFERNEFEDYNRAKEGTATGKDHYTARQLTLFEQIRLNDKNREQKYRYRYKLKPLCPDALMPILAEDYEPTDRTDAQKEYQELWEGFIKGLKQIPEAHRKNLPLWLDHFESLWGCYTHAIPSATAFNTRPDVSLYDHSRTTAALAVALWRYHHERGDDPANATVEMRSRHDWDEQKLLLIQGDFFGIQDFIFATGGETQKRAAKLLRGRSCYVSLLTECAALKVLESLGLPATCQIINAAGKFLIVAPNTEQVRNTLEQVKQELNRWFLTNNWGTSGIGLAALPACCNDFLKQRSTGEENTPFQTLMKKLFEELEKAKLTRFDLCNQLTESAIFTGFSDQFQKDKGVCKIDGVSPATRNEDGIAISNLASDQIRVGGYLTEYKRFLITRQALDHNTLRLPVFGYYINFTRDEEITGQFSRLAVEGKLLRAIDFSLPESDGGNVALWNGYARRHINGYVPRLSDNDVTDSDRYKNIAGEINSGDIKTLNHLACEGGGVNALMTLKGDVDNLGLIFQQGLVRSGFENSSGYKEGLTFAKMTALSRQMDAFFTIYLPYRCRKEYPDTYTVFAGGDDFFLVGPWRSQIKLAKDMRQWFKDYVMNNPEVHFSVGLSMTKPGLPIRRLGEQAEHALDQAKQYNPQNCHPAPKNAVTCYGQSVDWNGFENLTNKADELENLADDLKLSTGYLYGLLQFTDMQAEIEKKPENAMWHSWFAYRTKRLLERRRGLSDEQRQSWHSRLAEEIAASGIRTHGQAYKITLFTYLYKHRTED